MSAAIPGQESIQARKRSVSAKKSSKRSLASGALVEAILGLAAIVLVIIGLSEVMPIMMGAIAVIVGGIGWLSEASILMTEYRSVVRRAQVKTWEKVELSSGCSIEAITGIAAIVLGILVLLGITPLFFLPIAATALGMGLVVMSATVPSIHAVDMEMPEGEDSDYEPKEKESEDAASAREMKSSEASAEESHAYEVKSAGAPADGDRARQSNPSRASEERAEGGAEAIVHAALSAATGVQVVLGFAATVIGLLALVGFSPQLFTLVSILMIGVAALMIGVAISGRAFSVHTA